MGNCCTQRDEEHAKALKEETLKLADRANTETTEGTTVGDDPKVSE